MIAEIILTGSELLKGKVCDENGIYAGRIFHSRGVAVRRIVTVGDDADTITGELKRAMGSSEIIILSGGLGGTMDDLIRDVFIKMGVPLRVSATAKGHLEKILHSRGKNITKLDEKTFLFPENSIELSNPIGTALGIMWKTNKNTIFILPGVPDEFRAMFDMHVTPFLEKIRGTEILSKNWTLFGVREVELNEVLSEYKRLDEINLLFLPDYPLLRLEASASKNKRDDLEEVLQDFEQFLLSTVKDNIFYRGFTHPGEVIKKILLERGQTLSTAESCTGGEIASTITDVSGASEYYLGGVVTYSVEEKIRVLGIPGTLIDKYGVVSKEVAEQMSRKIKGITNSDWAISTTGYAGPTGGDKKNPVGTVYVGISDPSGKTVSFHYYFRGTRERLKKSFSLSALYSLLLKIRKTYGVEP